MVTRGKFAEAEVERSPDAFAAGVGHLPGLDGLRGLAVVLVVLTHFGRIEDPQSVFAKLVTKVTDAGWVGVDLFFVLSGFLITRILVDSRGNPHYFRNFYMRRTLRIFPLYYAALAIVFGAGGLFHWFNTPELVRSQHEQIYLWTYLTNFRIPYELTFFHVNLLEQSWVQLNSFWSLAVEEHFYLMWPALVFFVPRRRLTQCCYGLIGFAFACRAATMVLHLHTDWAFMTTPCRIDGLSIGALLALYGGNAESGLRLKRAVPAVLIVLSPILLLINSARSEYTEVYTVLKFTLLAIFFAAILVGAVTARPKSPVDKLVNNRLLRELGKISYGIYVFHGCLIWVLDRIDPLWPRLLAAGLQVTGTLWHCLFALACSSALAFASYHLYERQFLKLQRYFRPVSSSI